MSGVKANWYVDLSGVSDQDPFGDEPVALRVEEVGRRVDLRDPHQSLIELLNAEGALFEEGIVCSIKDNNNSCCAVCPVRRTDSLDPMKALCDIGVQQEVVLTAAVVQRANAN